MIKIQSRLKSSKVIPSLFELDILVRKALKKTIFVTNVTKQGGLEWVHVTKKTIVSVSKSILSHLKHFLRLFFRGIMGGQALTG